MFILHLVVDSVSLGSWFIVFKVLTLNVGMLIISHLSKLGSGFVADSSNTGVRAPNSAEHGPCLPALKLMWFRCTTWIRVMVVFYWLFFF